MNKVTLRTWVRGARPQTLPLALVPVLLAAGLVAVTVTIGTHELALLMLCALVALALQIGVNFANDYSDGIRGTDADRVGPQRLVGSGLVRPRLVRTVAFVWFGIAAMAGVGVLALSGAWWLVLVGAACLAAAWLYTGGKHPYGYMPLGEVMVLVFFGFVPILGTVYVVTGSVPAFAWLLGAAAGSLAAAVLLTNNLRDRVKDAGHGKRTLSVRIGDRASRVLFAVFLIVPFIAVAPITAVYPGVLFVYLVFVLVGLPLIVQLFDAKTPFALVQTLKRTLFVALLFSLTVTLALFLA